MKKIYFLFLLFSLPFIGFSQSSLIIEDEDGNDKSGTVILIEDEDVGVYDLHIDLRVKNTSGSSKNVLVKRYEEQYVAGSKEYYCFYVCYPPTNSGTYAIWQDQTSVAITSDDTHLLSSHLLPNNNAGISRYRFVAYVENNPSDSVEVFIEYRVGSAVGIDLDGSMVQTSSLNIYPNPASKEITIDYALAKNHKNSAQMVIRNLLGEVVKNVDLTKSFNKQTLDISNLESGVYFYSLLVEGKALSSKRLVVK